MNLKHLPISIALALAATAAGQASAAGLVAGTQITQQFNLTAKVNATLQLTDTDGSALSSNLALDYDLAKQAFKPKVVMANLATNTNTNDIVASIAGQAQMTNGNTAIPLKVTLNGEELSSTVKVFKATELFGSNAYSTPVTLVFAQKDDSAVNAAGTYTGSIQLMLQQQTPTTPPAN